MKKTCLFAIALSVCACRQYPSVDADKELLAEFDRMCEEHASEFVTDNSAVGGLRIPQLRLPYDSGPGRANRPVYEPEYGSEGLAKALLTPPNNIAYVRFVYQPYPSDWKYVPVECRGQFYIDLRDPKDRVPTGAPGVCEKLAPYDKERDETRYVVAYEYGKLDVNEIRQFSVRLYDAVSERVLAEQKSFQLLRGNLSDANRSFTYLGQHQRAYTCRLSPPDLLIKRAFQQAKIGGGRHHVAPLAPN